MAKKYYEKLIFNLILGVCIAIFAKYSRVEDWKSGHRKLNSLFKTFSINDTKLDKTKLKTNFGYKLQ